MERLADLTAEIEPAIEQDVGQREALAAEIFPAVRHLAVEPLQAVGRDHLQPRRGVRCHRNPLFEKCQRLAEAVAVGKVLADIEVDAARPHPALGALFGVASDHRRLLLLLFERFAGGGDLGKIAAVVELESRHLAVRIALEMFGLPVLAAAQVDGLPGDFNALLRHEHAYNARVWPDRIVELHELVPHRLYRRSALSRSPGPLSNSAAKL